MGGFTNILEVGMRVALWVGLLAVLCAARTIPKPDTPQTELEEAVSCTANGGTCRTRVDLIGLASFEAPTLTCSEAGEVLAESRLLCPTETEICCLPKQKIAMIVPLYYGEPPSIFTNIIENFRRQYSYHDQTYTPTLVIVDDRFLPNKRLHFDNKVFVLNDNKEFEIKYDQTVNIDVYVESEDFVEWVTTGEEFQKEYQPWVNENARFGKWKVSTVFGLRNMTRRFNQSTRNLFTGVLRSGIGNTISESVSNHLHRFSLRLPVPFRRYRIVEKIPGDLAAAEMFLYHLDLHTENENLKKMILELLNVPSSMPLASEVVPRTMDAEKFQFRNLGIKRNIGIQAAMKHMNGVRFVAMIDSDDFYRAGYLEQLAQASHRFPASHTVVKVNSFTQVFILAGSDPKVCYGTQPVAANLHYGALFFLKRELVWDDLQDAPLAQYLTMTFNGIDELGFAHHVHKLEALGLVAPNGQDVVDLGADAFVRVKLYKNRDQLIERAQIMAKKNVCLDKAVIQEYWNADLHHDDLAPFGTIRAVTNALPNLCKEKLD